MRGKSSIEESRLFLRGVEEGIVRTERGDNISRFLFNNENNLTQQEKINIIGKFYFWSLNCQTHIQYPHGC